jgi:hypothetical protein
VEISADGKLGALTKDELSRVEWGRSRTVKVDQRRSYYEIGYDMVCTIISIKTVQYSTPNGLLSDTIASHRSVLGGDLPEHQVWTDLNFYP